MLLQVIVRTMTCRLFSFDAIICNLLQPPEVKAMLEGESRQLPWQHLAVLVLLTAGASSWCKHLDTASPPCSATTTIRSRIGRCALQRVSL